MDNREQMIFSGHKYYTDMYVETIDEMTLSATEKLAAYSIFMANWLNAIDAGAVEVTETAEAWQIGMHPGVQDMLQEAIYEAANDMQQENQERTLH